MTYPGLDPPLPVLVLLIISEMVPHKFDIKTTYEMVLWQLVVVFNLYNPCQYCSPYCHCRCRRGRGGVGMLTILLLYLDG